MYVEKCFSNVLNEWLPLSEMLGLVNYIGMHDVLRLHPGFIIVVTNVPLLSVDEAIRGYKGFRIVEGNVLAWAEQLGVDEAHGA